jgi:hypothetical protein
MRRRLVDSYTDPATTIQYGLRGSPVDFALAQGYTHDHVQQATRDFLMKNAGASLVEGFDYTLAGQLKLSIAAGRAYDAAGVFYETITDPAGQPTVVTLDAADPAQPRIDLVYAVLEAGVQAVALTRMFRRVASDAELTANGGRNPYLPQPIERFSEEHARARVLVRKGVAAAVPVAPAANAGEVPLFQVRVNAGAAVLVVGNVTDVRTRVRSLATALALIDTLNSSPAITNLNGAIDARVAADVADGTYLTKAVAGAVVTLDLDLAALDPRYVNADGDSMTGPLSLDRGATGVSMSGFHGGVFQANGGLAPGVPVRGLVGIGRVNGLNGGDPGTAVGVYGRAKHDGGPSNNVPVAIGGSFEVEQSGIPGAPNHYGVYASTGGATGANQYAVYANGKLHATGALSAASKNFQIDHPLAPNSKDLVHASVESNRYGLLYWFEATLAAGTVDVDLDAALGFSPGTAKALMGETVRVLSVRHPDGTHVLDEVLVAEDPGVGVSITLTSADAADAATVIVQVGAERRDPVIMTAPFVDEFGHFGSERDKPALTAEDLALLEDLMIPVPAGDPLAGESFVETLPSLIGRAGFPWQPWAVAGGATPTRSVTYEEEEE